MESAPLRIDASAQRDGADRRVTTRSALEGATVPIQAILLHATAAACSVGFASVLSDGRAPIAQRASVRTIAQDVATAIRAVVASAPKAGEAPTARSPSAVLRIAPATVPATATLRLASVRMATLGQRVMVPSVAMTAAATASVTSRMYAPVSLDGEDRTAANHRADRQTARPLPAMAYASDRIDASVRPDGVDLNA